MRTTVDLPDGLYRTPKAQAAWNGETLRDLERRTDLRGGGWADADLTAFAVAGEHRLVAFDGGFRRYPGLSFSHLRA